MLLLGVIAGLTVAMASVLAPDGPSLPDSAVARVNDHYITRAAYSRALAAVATDKRDPLTVEDRRRILNRLIDEELLLQYGLRRGLARNDTQVRAALVQSVMMARTLEAEALEISDDDARIFYQANRTLFSATERVRVGVIRVPATDSRTLEEARVRASEAGRRLEEGEPFAAVADGYHEGGVLTLPDAPLPRAKLVDYLGPTLADQALALEAGRADKPVLVGRAWQLLYVHERVAAPASEFSAVADLVRSEMRRRAAEDALRGSLDAMRSSETIVVADPLGD